MMPVQSLGVAIIGDEDQVALMRLAGVERYEVIQGNHDIREEVREALTRFIRDPSIGIIVIPENYEDYVNDLLSQVRGEKKVTPVIVEVPSKFGTEWQDVKAYYKDYTKSLIGFTVEI